MIDPNTIVKVSSQFTIDENNIIINISEKRQMSKERYFPRRGTLEQLENDTYNIPFYFHYITDKNLLGINGKRETEKSVIPIALGLKLNSDNYYVDERTKDVYEYKDGLYPLIVAQHSNWISYYVVNLNFNNEVK